MRIILSIILFLTVTIKHIQALKCFSLFLFNFINIFHLEIGLINLCYLTLYLTYDINPSIYQPNYPSTHLPNYLPLHLFIRLPFCLSVCPSIYPSINLSIGPSIIHPPICLPVCPFVHSNAGLCEHLEAFKTKSRTQLHFFVLTLYLVSYAFIHQ